MLTLANLAYLEIDLNFSNCEDFNNLFFLFSVSKCIKIRTRLLNMKKTYSISTE